MTHRGFTLSEMLVVLMIVAATTLLGTAVYRNSAKGVHERRFFDQFEARWQAAVKHCMQTNSRAEVEFGERGVKFELKDATNVAVPNWYVAYPRGMKVVNQERLQLRERYGQTQGKTIQLVSKTYHYRLIFQIGGGRYRIEQTAQ